MFSKYNLAKIKRFVKDENEKIYHSSFQSKQVLEEWLRNNQNVGKKVEGRLVYKK